MASLAEKLSEQVGAAFAACGLPETMGVVRVSDRPDLAQFQCNGAMAAAKQAKKNPRAVAEEIVALLKENAIFSRVEIAGPGFINIDIHDHVLQDHMASVATDARLGVGDIGAGRMVVLDYGGPNIAKPMHVGHLRASIIGDSVRRILAFAGYRTLGDVHMGDWGTHMGMIISEYLDTGRADYVLGLDLDNEAHVAELMEDLSAMYPRVAAACKEDEARKARAQDATLQIQNNVPEYKALWEVIREASVRGMRRNFEALNVHFDLWKGEADVHGLIPAMVDDLKARHVAVEDDGALVVHVKAEGDTKEVPPLILYKRDGAVMYGTTDLATILERMDLYKPEKIIYVVDQRQHLHFEQVFRAARLSGIAPASVELTHAGFGTMNGPDGKPFKTRTGGVMKLEDLIQMGIERASARLAEAKLGADFAQDEKDDIAHKVAIAAIKFADLQNQRQADYIFDLDRLTSFEGKTGPYLLYQVVRIKSLLRKAQAQGLGYEAGRFRLSDSDRALALLLGEFPDVVEGAQRHYTPHVLCDYAFRLSQQFSSFYAQCHILSEKDEDIRASRLALCALTAQMLAQILALLGIDVPERM